MTNKIIKIFGLLFATILFVTMMLCYLQVYKIDADAVVKLRNEHIEKLEQLVLEKECYIREMELKWSERNCRCNCEN